MSERFDAVVIGAGPAGEVAASRPSDQGLATALIERELVGGECSSGPGPWGRWRASGFTKPSWR
jgi:pyruvate/2-oxoglutarate dehydrogenase complex dihydrolipoamide dehydrogenase (E3) component